MIKILHTGDVHLDSPFSGMSAEAAAARRRELRETFSDMMAYARSASVDLVLIAGDLLDRRFATGETVQLIKDELSALDCPVVISPGNHDPADGKGIWNSTFPGNVHIFTEETLSRISIDTLGVDVYGYAFTSGELTSSPVAGEFAHDKSKINILLCHADMTSPVSVAAPLSKAQIESFGADYTALGHIHNGEAYSGIAGDCVYAYCGCPEGRDFGECGVKGAIICEINGGVGERRVTLSRKPFCRKRYEDITVPVDGAVSMAEVCRAAKDACMLMDERTILRITFTGTVDPELVIESGTVEAAIPTVPSVTVRDRTSPSLSFSVDDPTVRGEFCRLLAPLLGSADPAERETAVTALRMGLSSLSGNDLS
ncbi:MAG: DNA repair exonuclease [Ruminococcaceae bacterium]|nr:DNA repair exonuclease [Oscillospiraceae bacterium]